MHNGPNSCWLLATGRWLVVVGHLIFLNVARIGLASRQLPEASSQLVTHLLS